ncbi:Proto-oncogene DBL [Collichthys lucidus]|uniref:Proto-oncogene DBL n=1 Tax=Collichthys lucidus TaxID=240159 RepID=A0A4U5UCV6_COLLU|nr:Proto-oncogene DBL [Collichthys lucidus]
MTRGDEELGRREGNIAVSGASLRLRGSSSSSAAAVDRRPRELHYLELGTDFGNLHLTEMASNTMADCFYRRGIPKMRRSPASFPGNLHLVLVLRPTSFFHRTVTDIGFRFSQEDFMLKMPVVMLSSVTDLLRYIDENQLTSEFGGTLDYCHSDWIVLRTAIESFAVTVKDIAQMLQGFGTELAETDMPDEGKAIEYLLESHTDKYRKLKDAIRSVSKEGRHLLLSLETSGKEDDSQWDVRLDWETVQRLLAQLRDMESAFDGFFEKHHLKLHQYLQLLRYEQSFQEAQTWCDDGAYLLANQLVDKFQSKEGAQAALREIERFLEGAPSLLKSGPDILAIEYEAVITPQLQAHIGETFAKHTTVQQMIQSRQACLRKLADKHVRPIQLVAPRPENPPRSKSPLFSPKHGDGLKFTFDISLPGKRASRKSPNPRKIEVIHDYQESRSCVSYSLEGEDSPDQLKRHVMRELIETERIYVEELLSVLLGYRAEMDNPALSGTLPPILRSKRDILFGNMPEIYNFHSRVFLQDLEGCLEAPEGVGACFLERKESFQMYELYCQNKPRSEALWRQFSDCAFFQECQKKLEHKLGLDSYLLKPVQRLTKYQLLLKELLKFSTDCKGTSELQEALTAMLDLLKSVNDSMHQIAITGYEGDICELGRVLMQGSFSVWISHKRGPTRMKELARFKPMQRHLFLYERALLFCKRREEHGDGSDKTPSYSFKHCLKMTAVGITENVKGDVKKFEIWYSGREEVYVVQAPTVEVKMAWLNELRRILTNQQKLLRAVCENGRRPPICPLLSSCLSPFLRSPHLQGHAAVQRGSQGLSAGAGLCLAVSRRVYVSAFPKPPSQKPPATAPAAAPPPPPTPLTCPNAQCKQQRASVSSEDTESGRSSPDPQHHSPKHQHNRRSWPGAHHSVDICEGLEEWPGGRDAFHPSDTEEEVLVQLSPGRYMALADCLQNGPDSITIKCGDVIQLQHEDNKGRWLVKNLSRRQEGFITAASLQLIIGDSSRGHSSRLGDPGNLKVRKLSSP